MSDAMRSVIRFVVFALALAVVLFACGLITRPAARFLPNLYSFHAVLMALPSACAIAFCLRKEGRFSLCVVGVCLFATALGSMSLLMGFAAVVPLVLSAVVWLVLRRFDKDRRAYAAGFAYGALYYPCTIALSVLGGGLVASLETTSLITIVVSSALGGALALLGALLAAGKSRAAVSKRV